LPKRHPQRYFLAAPVDYAMTQWDKYLMQWGRYPYKFFNGDKPPLALRSAEPWLTYPIVMCLLDGTDVDAPGAVRAVFNKSNPKVFDVVYHSRPRGAILHRGHHRQPIGQHQGQSYARLRSQSASGRYHGGADWANFGIPPIPPFSLATRHSRMEFESKVIPKH